MSVWLNHYDRGVPSELAPPDETLTAMLSESCRRFPRRAAVWSPNGALSYQQLLSEVQKFAAVLAYYGVRAGDRVLLAMPDSVPFVVTFYGTLWRGAVAVLSSADFPSQLTVGHLRDSSPKVAVVGYPLDETIQAGLRAHPPEQVLVCSGREYVRNLRGYFRGAVKKVLGLGRKQKIRRYRSAMRRASDGFPFEAVEVEAPAVIAYTGGTTGLPRGVLLSHRALRANVSQLLAWDTKLGKRERIFAGLPLTHAYGFTAGLNLSLACGGTLILGQTRSPEKILDLCRRFKPTLFPGVPALYGQLLGRRDLRSYGLRSIRACISGAAPLPVEVQEGFEKITKGRLVEGYGLTEAGPVTHANPLYGRRRAGSIGLPLPGTEAKVVSLETGQDVGPGRVGELLVRGPQLMSGYWNRPEETSKALQDGWLHTRDLAQMDSEGYFFLINRISEIIHLERGPVYPRDVEEVLYEHPAVAEAAVRGGHSFDGLAAFIVPRNSKKIPSEAEILKYCTRRLPPQLRVDQVRFVQGLPRNPFGKLLRRELPEV